MLHYGVYIQSYNRLYRYNLSDTPWHTANISACSQGIIHRNTYKQRHSPTDN